MTERGNRRSVHIGGALDVLLGHSGEKVMCRRFRELGADRVSHPRSGLPQSQSLWRR